MPTQALIFDNSSECKDYSQCLLSISRDQNALHRSKIALSALLMLPYFKLTNHTIMPIRTSPWLLITSLNVYISHVQSRVSRAGQSSWRSCIMHIMWSKVYKAEESKRSSSLQRKQRVALATPYTSAEVLIYTLWFVCIAHKQQHIISPNLWMLSVNAFKTVSSIIFVTRVLVVSFFPSSAC